VFPTASGADATRETASLGVTVSQLLLLVGHLDDTPGFDTPRERFRRFLIDRVTDSHLIRSFVEQCQRSIGEQHHRALQDGIALLGRFLGFETEFGTYQRLAGAIKFDGQWLSRRRLHVVLEVRTDQTPRPDLDSLARSLAALTLTTHLDPEARRVGLCVVTPLYAGRRLEEVPAADGHQDLRVISSRSLLWLADMVGNGRLKHDDVVRLLTPASLLDPMVDMLDRLANGEVQIPLTFPLPSRSGSDYWVGFVLGDAMASPEQIVESVIAKRQVLGASFAGGLESGVHTDDWLCFFLPGKGVVGHAQVAMLLEDRGDLIRESNRFSRLLRLKNLVLYDAPVPMDVVTELHLSAGIRNVGAAGTVLAPLTKQEFLKCTLFREEPPDRVSASVSETSRSTESLPQAEP